MSTNVEQKLSNFQKHLYFENFPQSREFALDKCNKVLAMIAQLKDRNHSIRQSCEALYGRNENGFIKAPEYESQKYSSNIEKIKRLQKYFNYCLLRVTRFS